MKNFILFLFWLLVIMLHLSFFSSSPYLRVSIHFPLLFLLNSIFFIRFSKVFLMTVASGIVLDYYSTSLFGSITLSLSLAILIARLLIIKAFPHRSLLRLLSVIALATGAYLGFFWVLNWIFFFLSFQDNSPFNVGIPLFHVAGTMIILHLGIAGFSAIIGKKIMKSFQYHFLPL